MSGAGGGFESIVQKRQGLSIETMLYLGEAARALIDRAITPERSAL